jgi:hypothetical protein
MIQLVKINVPQQSLPDIAGRFFFGQWGIISCSEPLLWQLSLRGGWDWVKNISKCMWYICASQEQRQKPSCDMVLLVWFVYSHSNHGLFPDPCSTSQWNPTNVGTPLMVYTTHSWKKCMSLLKLRRFFTLLYNHKPVGVFDAHVIPAPYSKPPNSTLEGILAIRLQALQEARQRPATLRWSTARNWI